MNEYQPAPVGEIEVEVVAASIGDVKWKASDENPRGECLRLRLTAGRDYSFIFSDVPLDWRSMLQAVRRATGVAGEQLRPEEFVGRRARVVLNHYTAKDGSTRANVTRWLGPAKPEPTATLTDAIDAWAKAEPPGQPARRVDDLTSVSRRTSRNAVPKHGADDDIPF